MSIIITLTTEEVRLAALVEVARRTQNLERKTINRYGAKDTWTNGIEGAAAEMAVAKWLNRFWSGAVGDWSAGDVGNLQVRSTHHRNGRLILHHEDRDDDAFILAIGVAPTFRLVGWLRARDGKKPEYWDDPVGERPAFFVPQHVLRPMRRKDEAA